MVHSEAIMEVGQRGFALRSIQRPDARVSVLYQHGDLEVVAVELGAGASLAEPSLWGGPSWHLVVEGQATFRQRARSWELLPDESLHLKDSTPYTIVNRAPGRLKLFTLLFKNHRTGGGRR